jgi:hypothetical protein
MALRRNRAPPADVFRSIMDHMTALAEGFQVARPVVGGIVVDMGGGEVDTR